MSHDPPCKREFQNKLFKMVSGPFDQIVKFPHSCNGRGGEGTAVDCFICKSVSH